MARGERHALLSETVWPHGTQAIKRFELSSAAIAAHVAAVAQLTGGRADSKPAEAKPAFADVLAGAEAVLSRYVESSGEGRPAGGEAMLRAGGKAAAAVFTIGEVCAAAYIVWMPLGLCSRSLTVIKHDHRCPHNEVRTSHGCASPVALNPSEPMVGRLACGPQVALLRQAKASDRVVMLVQALTSSHLLTPRSSDATASSAARRIALPDPLQAGRLDPSPRHDCPLHHCPVCMRSTRGVIDTWRAPPAPQRGMNRNLLRFRYC